jgi:hypothetical protein
MDLIAEIVGLLVVAVIGAIAVGLSHKYSRRPVGEFPGMGRLNVPCDPALHTDFLNALTGEKIHFIPPTQAMPATMSPDKMQDSPLCVVQVAEKDYERAKKILAGFQGKWFS